MAAASIYTTSQGFREYLIARKKLEDTITKLAQRSNRNEQFIDSIMRIAEERRVAHLDFSDMMKRVG